MIGIKQKLVEKDTFIIPFEKNQYLIYVPKERTCFTCDRQSIFSLKIENFQELCRSSKRIDFTNDYDSDSRKKLRLIILLTYFCNMDCKYCYAKYKRSTDEIDLNFVQCAIDYLIGYNPNYMELNLEFHGGGEPFSSFPLMQKIVIQARLKCKKVTITAITNGLLNQEQIDWIIKNDVDLVISFDGPAKFQNFQRPLTQNIDSHHFVENTLKELNRRQFDYQIRCTITNFSEDSIVEIVAYFIRLGTKKIHLEPMFEYEQNKGILKSPSPSKFVKNFISALELCEENFVELTCSCLRVGGGRFSHCIMMDEDDSILCITTDGFISSCYEVVSKSDNVSSQFFIGHFDETSKSLILNEEIREHLKSRSVEKIPKCKICIAKYDCAGDCAVKAFRVNKTLFNMERENFRCKITRKLLIYLLKRYAENNPLNTNYKWFKKGGN